MFEVNLGLLEWFWGSGQKTKEAHEPPFYVYKRACYKRLIIARVEYNIRTVILKVPKMHSRIPLFTSIQNLIETY